MGLDTRLSSYSRREMGTLFCERCRRPLPREFSGSNPQRTCASHCRGEQIVSRRLDRLQERPKSFRHADGDIGASDESDLGIGEAMTCKGNTRGGGIWSMREEEIISLYLRSRDVQSAKAALRENGYTRNVHGIYARMLKISKREAGHDRAR